MLIFYHHILIYFQFIFKYHFYFKILHAKVVPKSAYNTCDQINFPMPAVEDN